MTQTTHGETRAAAREASAERSHDTVRRRLFVMRSGARLFAVYADEVEATSENLTPTPLPFSPPPVRGVVSQRGRILTLIDPLSLLTDATPTGAPPAAEPNTDARPVVVVALTGDEQLALSVDGVEHDVELYDDEAEAASGASDSHPQHLLRRTIPYHTHAVALLDPARLFEAAMQGVDRRRRRT